MTVTRNGRPAAILLSVEDQKIVEVIDGAGLDLMAELAESLQALSNPPEAFVRLLGQIADGTARTRRP